MQKFSRAHIKPLLSAAGAAAGACTHGLKVRVLLLSQACILPWSGMTIGQSLTLQQMVYYVVIYSMYAAVEQRWVQRCFVSLASCAAVQVDPKVLCPSLRMHCRTLAWRQRPGDLQEDTSKTSMHPSTSLAAASMQR
jgi:hypothetical protein